MGGEGRAARGMGGVAVEMDSFGHFDGIDLGKVKRGCG